MAMTELPLSEVVMLAQRRLVLGFAQEQPIRHWLSQHDGGVVDVQYSHQVVMTIECPDAELPLLQDFAAGHQIDVVESSQAILTGRF